MATNSQPQETPDYRTFREHYSGLVAAIQDPLPLATRLFARSIIDCTLLQRMNTLGFTTFQNTNTLLSTVLGKIQTNPSAFGEFLLALNEDPSMQSLVESMQSKCFNGKDINSAHSLLPKSKELKKTVVTRQTVHRAGRTVF